MLIDIDFADILQNHGAGTIGVDIFAGLDQPSEPADAIFIVNTGTFQSNMPSLDYSYLSCQVTIRGAKGQRLAVDARTEEVLSMLHGLVDYSINDRRYVYIFQDSGPVSVLEDGTMRPKNIINFNAMRTSRN